MSWKTTANLNVRPLPNTTEEPFETLPKGTVLDEVVTEGWMPVMMDDNTIAWVSRKYLTEVVEGPGAPSVPVPAPIAEPVWIKWARSKLGQKEVPGAGDNPEIVSWYKLTTLPKEYWHDSTAWCAIFVNAALLLNGIKSLNSAAAVAYLKLGTKVTAPQKGDLVVWAHHVAFFLRDLGNGRIEVIGGNQGDAVTITTYPKDKAILGYRRPT